MASVKVFPRLDKVNKKGEVPIYLRLTKNRKSKYLALDVYIQPSEWNEKTGKVKPGAQNAAYINNYIAAKEAEAEAVALELETKSKTISATDIKSKLIGKIPDDFFAFAEKQCHLMYEEVSIGTSRRYKSLILKLKKFRGKDTLPFDELNVTFIREYQRYMLEELHNKPNTIHSCLKGIRRLINDAVAEELLPMEKNPFNKIKMKGQKTSRLFLLDDELERLKSLHFKKNIMLNHHRNLYIFSAFTAGIRISDLLLMRWKNFDGEHLYFQVSKNKEDLSVKLPETSLEIMAFYKKLAQKRSVKLDPESFIFPLLLISSTETNREKIHNAISAATAYMNKDLRTLCKLAEIDKKISFHTARHSWAVRALRKGMRIEYVSKLMGHASVKQTEVYAKILNGDLDKAMEVFNKL